MERFYAQLIVSTSLQFCLQLRGFSISLKDVPGMAIASNRFANTAGVRSIRTVLVRRLLSQSRRQHRFEPQAVSLAPLVSVSMTASTLRAYNCKDLAQMARLEGVSGWHAMRKDELVDALVKAARRRKSASSRGETKRPTARSTSPGPRAPEKARRTPARISSMNRRASEQKNLAAAGDGPAPRDRLVVMVRDPYWLHAVWELSAQCVERARSALGPDWHAARPVLRLFRVAADGSAKPLRQMEIHGGVRHWYIDVADPPSSFRLEIGYATANAQFYSLARSNTVTTPAPGSEEMVDRNWSDVADNADRIYAMSGGYSADGVSLELQELLEERLRRKLGRPSNTRYGAGAAVVGGETLKLALDAELIVFGSTSPTAHVTVQGEPAEIRPDGSFAVKIHLPERRQVIPVVASSPDGVEQRTVILGVERNTKVLDATSRDSSSI